MTVAQHRSSWSWVVIVALAVLAPALRGADDQARAVSYDAAWLDGWVHHCQSLYRIQGKTPGLVLFIGDSITRFRENAMWPLLGRGQTADDHALIAWAHGDQFNFASTTDVTNPNGWYLSTVDVTSTRAMTAAGGIDSTGLLTGSGLQGNSMPTTAVSNVAQATITDGHDFPANLNIADVVAAFPMAQFAVLEVGTNDVNTGRDASTYAANLAQIVGHLESANIVPILCTLPPRPDDYTNGLVIGYNAAVRAFAQSHGLPLIDFNTEILARRPGASWKGTLIVSNDVHPTASGAGYDVYSDPYADGGDPASHTTGAACRNVGFLLRSWLVVQKLKQVKSLVADAPAGAPAASHSAGAASSNSSHCGIGSAFGMIGLGLWWRGRRRSCRWRR